MALYTGVTGYIKFGSGVANQDVAHMSTWEVELSKEIVEVVSFGRSYKEKVPSIKDWSASAEGAADFDAGAGQADLLEAFETGELLTFGFGITPEIFIEGTGYIESLTISDEADGNVSVSISVAGSDAVVLTIEDTATITFDVSHAGGDIEGAVVNLDGQLKLTDASGIAVFRGVPYSTVAYTVAKGGFVTQADDLVVSADATEAITLVAV